MVLAEEVATQSRRTSQKTRRVRTEIKADASSVEWSERVESNARKSIGPKYRYAYATGVRRTDHVDNDHAHRRSKYGIHSQREDH